MAYKQLLVAAIFLLVAGAGYLFVSNTPVADEAVQDLDPTPRNVTLTGTYVCLPHLPSSGVQTEECAFGLRTDDGVHYAANFGASADAMQQFQSGARITAEGFVVIKEALSSHQWAKYDMEGIFTITQVQPPAPAAQGKININAVCVGALAYMSFSDGESAAAFVAECIEGKHPEVIERFKAEMGLGDGATI